MDPPAGNVGNGVPPQQPPVIAQKQYIHMTAQEYVDAMRLVLEQSSSDYQKFVERLPEIFRHVAPQRPLVGEERALQLISEKDHNFHTFPLILVTF